MIDDNDDVREAKNTRHETSNDYGLSNPEVEPRHNDACSYRRGELELKLNLALFLTLPPSPHPDEPSCLFCGTTTFSFTAPRLLNPLFLGGCLTP